MDCGEMSKSWRSDSKTLNTGPSVGFFSFSSLKKSPVEASWMFSRVRESPLFVVALPVVAVRPLASFKNDDAHRDIAFVSLQFVQHAQPDDPLCSP